MKPKLNSIVINFAQCCSTVCADFATPIYATAFRKYIIIIIIIIHIQRLFYILSPKINCKHTILAISVMNSDQHGISLHYDWWTLWIIFKLLFYDKCAVNNSTLALSNVYNILKQLHMRKWQFQLTLRKIIIIMYHIPRESNKNWQNNCFNKIVVQTSYMYKIIMSTSLALVLQR